VGTVHRPDPSPPSEASVAGTTTAAGPTLARATTAFLDTLESPGTRRAYAATLRALVNHLRAATPLAAPTQRTASERIAGWFTSRWGSAAPATFNRNLDALRAALGYWARR
jgi:hypothetical protein